MEGPGARIISLFRVGADIDGTTGVPVTHKGSVSAMIIIASSSIHIDMLNLPSYDSIFCMWWTVMEYSHTVCYSRTSTVSGQCYADINYMPH